jgi:hypothetical protein
MIRYSCRQAVGITHTLDVTAQPNQQALLLRRTVNEENT